MAKSLEHKRGIVRARLAHKASTDAVGRKWIGRIVQYTVTDAECGNQELECRVHGYECRCTAVRLQQYLQQCCTLVLPQSSAAKRHGTKCQITVCSDLQITA